MGGHLHHIYRETNLVADGPFLLSLHTRRHCTFIVNQWSRNRAENRTENNSLIELAKKDINFKFFNRDERNRKRYIIELSENEKFVRYIKNIICYKCKEYKHTIK